MLNRKLLYFLSSQLMCTGQAEIYLMLNTVSNSYEQIVNKRPKISCKQIHTL